MTGMHSLGELQYAIMRVLWDEGEATVARVQELLAAGTERDRALTTIATMLTKLEKKGVVAHTSSGRQFVYRALIDEKDVHRSMVGELTQRLFQGDYSALVSHLLTEQEIDKRDIERLKALIADKAGKEKRRGR
ncbi:MAG: BlaI/MecI/CopY family transcriptional regulator [Planctomycetes bacterium]|nr:BlaI/MecI/CopY family transcriptional regulator [Planctomycetota bacterium]